MKLYKPGGSINSMVAESNAVLGPKPKIIKLAKNNTNQKPWLRAAVAYARELGAANLFKKIFNKNICRLEVQSSTLDLNLQKKNCSSSRF